MANLAIKTRKYRVWFQPGPDANAPRTLFGGARYPAAECRIVELPADFIHPKMDRRYITFTVERFDGESELGNGRFRAPEHSLRVRRGIHSDHNYIRT